MRVTIEGTIEQIRDAALQLAEGVEDDSEEVSFRRHKRIEAIRRNKLAREQFAAARATVHSAFLLARKNGDERMRELLDALTGRIDLFSIVSLAQEVLSPTTNEE